MYHSITYFGNILYNKASVFRFSSSNCSVLSATMSSRLLVYRSIMAIMLSTMLVFLQCIVEIYHVNYGSFSSYEITYLLTSKTLVSMIALILTFI